VYLNYAIVEKSLFGWIFKYFISSFKLFTSHIDKYWPSQIFSSF